MLRPCRPRLPRQGCGLSKTHTGQRTCLGGSTGDDALHGQRAHRRADKAEGLRPYGGAASRLLAATWGGRAQRQAGRQSAVPLPLREALMAATRNAASGSSQGAGGAPPCRRAGRSAGARRGPDLHEAAATALKGRGAKGERAWAHGQVGEEVAALGILGHRARQRVQLLHRQRAGVHAQQRLLRAHPRFRVGSWGEVSSSARPAAPLTARGRLCAAAPPARPTAPTHVV